MSLYEFVTEINEGDVNNGQIRLISGVKDDNDIMLKKSLEHIESHFSFVGILEKFDESLILLQKMYDWPIPYYQIKNKTTNRPILQEYDQKTISAIESLNAEDIILYNKMNELLETNLIKESYITKDLVKLKLLSKVHFFKVDTQNYVRNKLGKRIPLACKNVLKRCILKN